MIPDEIQQYVKQQIQASANANRFQLSSIPRHIHNGIDSPPVFQPTQIYTGNITANGGGTLPKGWTVNHGVYSLSFTAAFVGGETSGTLTQPWPDSEITNPVPVDMTFSNGNVRQAVVTYGSTAVTFSALSSAATARVTTVATGLYLINHNLGNNTIYTAVAAPNGFPTDPATPYALNIEINPDVLDVCVFSITTPALVNVGFSFVITVINNKNVNPPIYSV